MPVYDCTLKCMSNRHGAHAHSYTMSLVYGISFISSYNFVFPQYLSVNGGIQHTRLSSRRSCICIRNNTALSHFTHKSIRTGFFSRKRDDGTCNMGNNEYLKDVPERRRGWGGGGNQQAKWVTSHPTFANCITILCRHFTKKVENNELTFKIR